MTFFRNLDLYKAIILVSLVLLPASIGYVYWVDGRLDVARTAINNATKPRGELEKIGELCQNLSTVQRNATRGAEGISAKIFFEQAILGTDKDGGVPSSALQIGEPEQRNVSRPPATDIQVRIGLRDGNKDRKLTREFIGLMLYNCEIKDSQVWKLRKLRMTADEHQKYTSARAGQSPPVTAQDVWTVKDLVFARRQPQKGRR